MPSPVVFPEIPLWVWVLYNVVIFTFIGIDLFFHRKGDSPTFRRAISWVLVWVAVGVGTGALVGLYLGGSATLLYFTAYIVEYSLSFDNLFVFAVIFAYFSVPLAYQNKTLYIGIITAMVLRGVFIASGLELIARFDWMIGVFGAVLIYSGYRLARSGMGEVDPGRNPLVRFARRFAPVSDRYYGSKFIAQDEGKRYLTPLVLALLAIETTDIVFALDSIPAVIAITLNFFIAYTSNISAILGLRSLYTVLAMFMYKLKYLSKGLAVVLVFFGFKMIAGELGFVIPTLYSITIVLAVIAVAAALSVGLRKQTKPSPGGR
ncbi:MAG: TerC/Alx family metal homeostasis membrane protein [Conexivisphaerales archaeon]